MIRPMHDSIPGFCGNSKQALTVLSVSFVCQCSICFSTQPRVERDVTGFFRLIKKDKKTFQYSTTSRKGCNCRDITLAIAVRRPFQYSTTSRKGCNSGAPLCPLSTDSVFQYSTTSRKGCNISSRSSSRAANACFSTQPRVERDVTFFSSFFLPN